MSYRDSAQTIKNQTKPTVMTDAVVRKLCDALAKGYSIEMACEMVGIGRSTFYDYCRNNPDKERLFQVMRRMPTEQAVFNIVRAINAGDVKTSKWYLDRVFPETHSPAFMPDINSELAAGDQKPKKPASRILL